MNILVKADKCNNCQDCVRACLENHDTQRISIETEGKGIRIRVCRQCKKSQCARACTFEAIARDKDTNAIYTISEYCQACYACVRACPFDAVFVSEQTKQALMCDLCNGNPACVAVCKTGALTIIRD